MQQRHLNRELYFEEQKTTTERYVIPFIQELKPFDEDTSVLEIGCGEGGNLVAFLNAGCKKIVGVDLSKGKISNANVFFQKLNTSSEYKFINDNIYNISSKDIGQFDIILTRDVLEHIHNQQLFMEYILQFLKSDGKIFLGFPPWYNPFGGHQQMCESRFLSKLPYFHILPQFIYKAILKLFKESDQKINGLLEVKQTGISIERFEKIIRRKNFRKDRVLYYFINPNYEIKFGLKPRKAYKFIASIPFIRNFFITTCYYLISVDKKNK